MNIANKITLFRVALIPILIFFMLYNASHYMGIAFFIFIIASITDKLDGYIARKYNMITDLGKFLDPLADKLLISGALLVFIQLGKIDAWIVFAIIAREFAVTGLRCIAASNDIVIAASQMGKMKTVVQITSVIVLFIEDYLKGFTSFPITDIIIYLSLLITIVSGIDYLLKNKTVFLD